MRPEAKTWEEVVEDRLNCNSYAAMAVCGLVVEATDALTAANMVLSPETIAAMSATLAAIVTEAQKHLDGQTSTATGLHSRLRGLLRSTLPLLPPPFGAGDGDWEQWAHQVVVAIRPA